MTIMKTVLAVSAVALMAGSAQAATYSPDTFLGADNVSPSDPSNEVDALADILGLSPDDFEFTEKYVAEDDDGANDPYPVFDLMRDDGGNWYVNVDPNEPGYFVLKIGNGAKLPYSHYFYANDGAADEVSLLVWSNDFSVCSGEGFASTVDCASEVASFDAFMWDSYLETGTLGGVLSHITLIDGDTTPIPLPAAGWLLLGGLGGLAAMRRRNKV